ncbi:MAG: hypothetical protein IID46_07905 [Planctomycetes bacterium]|nr:hypothetical protein [Planctomycetota bacterium]
MSNAVHETINRCDFARHLAIGAETGAAALSVVGSGNAVPADAACQSRPHWHEKVPKVES